MKKHVEATPERLSTLRQRLFAVLAMLMVAIVLTVATSFAWLILSIRPEVSGITSNIGSNGSLEIALLDGETYKDLSMIKNPGVGESLETSSIAANNRYRSETACRSRAIRRTPLRSSRSSDPRAPAASGRARA